MQEVVNSVERESTHGHPRLFFGDFYITKKRWKLGLTVVIHILDQIQRKNINKIFNKHLSFIVKQETRTLQLNASQEVWWKIIPS